MAKKQEEKLIAGKSEADIRKAYFKGKIPQLLTEISENEEPAEEELVKLANFLASLQEQEKKHLATIRKTAPDLVIGNEGLKIPTIESSRTPEEKKKVEKFLAAAEDAVDTARRIMFRVYQNISNKVEVAGETYLDAGLEIAGILHLIDGHRVFKDQLYRQELTRIIRDAGCSRKEAEEWAKTSDQYAEYKRAVLFKEQIEEFIMLCKKKANINEN